MEETYITITAIDKYAGSKSFFPGMKVELRKDVENRFDDEAVAVYAVNGGKYGYVANSVYTVCRGTHSAGYIYRMFGDNTSCTIRFVGEDFAIALLENNS